MADPIALTALLLDAAIGWPQALYRWVGHPVGLFARIIETCETRWNKPARSDASRRALGILTVAILILMAGGLGLLLQALLVRLLGPWNWLGIALLAAPGLAQRSLHDHVLPVAKALENNDLATARIAVGMIVGRDTDRLDDAGVARAAIESLSESFCDGVTAPLFWLLLLGLPGIWIYKAINTADSLIGHREKRWRAFGWAAARTDDLLNLLPARLAGVLICLCAGRGWRVMARDAGKHDSPNAGWPEAAMAGALDVRLAGPIAYDGVLSPKAWIGDGSPQADAADVRHALTLYRRACLCLWLIAGGVAWAL
ncbi:adenosylcobinamide-phosphate synthase CbiB [Sphingobium aromaticiconvertens]|uniref:adenosylcobinamide-phosphate synthase CbiB n=1 Tax=Sphingobium aromaticiconvertens TaxID=365341 RepID=UPI00301AAB8B